MEGDNSSYGLENAAEALRKVEGVLIVEANHLSNTIYVEYDPNKISLDAIRKVAKSSDNSN